MLNAQEILKEAESLPVDERMRRGRIASQPERARPRNRPQMGGGRPHRLEELRSGQVQAVPGEAVFDKIRERFAR